MDDRRTEMALGLGLPALVLLALAIVSGRAATPADAAVALAFMATAPMLAALLARPLVTGIVAVATVLTAAVSAALAYGQDFRSALPVLVGVIVAAGAAVLAGQARVARAARSSRPQGTPARATGPVAGEPAAPGVDPVTGLPGRQAAERTLDREPSPGPRTVLLLGCDGISAVNADRGREIGDVFLFAVAGRTRYALPDEDLVARWDGDQVLAVLRGDPATVGPTLALVTDKVNLHPIRTEAGLVPLTVSAGAAAWPEGAPFAVALAHARRALHLAKAQGAARLVVAEGFADNETVT